MSPGQEVGGRAARGQRARGLCVQTLGAGFLLKGNRPMLKDFQRWRWEGQVAGSGRDPTSHRSWREGSSGTEERRRL